MDIGRLELGEKLSAAAGIALFLLMFFSWYEISSPELGRGLFNVKVDDGISAWQAYDILDLLLLVTAIVAVGSAVLKASGNTFELPVAPALAVAILGGISALTVLYRVIEPPALLDLKAGVFLGLIAAALVAVGGFQSTRSIQRRHPEVM